MATTVTPKELADEFGTDSKTLRKFLRDVTPRESQPGKGGRWEIERKSVRGLRPRFLKWNVEQQEQRAARAAEKAAQTRAELAGEELEETPEEAPES